MIFTIIGYIVSGILIGLIESVRLRRKSPDLLTIFNLMLVIQIVLPSIAILTIKLIAGTVDSGVPFFDKVVNNVGQAELFTSLILFVLFILSLYVAWGVMSYHFNLNRKYTHKVAATVSGVKWAVIMLLGLGCFLVIVNKLGGYANLILFRTEWNSADKTFLTANLFSLSTTFLLISLFGIVKYRDNKLSMPFLFSLVCTISFAAMTASRRPILIIIILLFFVKLLENRRPFIDRWTVVLLAISVPVLLFGKNVLWRLSHNQEITSSIVNNSFAGASGAIVKLAANIGITNIESWATLLYIDIPLRFGMDHLLSVLRRIPDGLLGLDLGFPERMVRISTTIFAGSGSADIPTGFVGQMWLDYGVLGPIIYGVGFAMLIALLQLLFNRVRMSCSGIMFFVLLMYVVTLPVRSGTLDFVFSVNIFALIIFMLLIIKIRVSKKAAS